MEKAKLNVFKSKKGKPVIQVIFENGKKMPVPRLDVEDPLSFNGKEVEVERIRGPIERILFEGREIYKVNSQSRNNEKKPARSHKGQKTKFPPKLSTTPYNFVPLNEQVVPAEEIPEFDRYHRERYTGYIDLKIQTLTPLYIRDTLNMEEYKKREELKEKSKQEKDKKTFINPDFFSPGGLIRIPGSSLRGMIRTMVEIMSFGKFQFYDDKRLYFRFFADRYKELRDYYRRRAGNVQAGVLIKKGYRNYIIKRTSYKKIKDVSRAEEIVKTGKGWIIYSGKMQNKKHNWEIAMPAPDAEEYPVDYNWVIKTYLDDSSRKSKLNLVKMLDDKDFRDGVPCFFSLDEKGRVTAIGHTRYFRMPYMNTISARVNQTNDGITDIAEAIFGNEKTHAGRIFFEDALLETPGSNVLMKEEIPKILSGPKPTCIQHYLKQKNLPKLLHYDDNSTIRGFKLYWHRDPKEWVETSLSFDEQKFEKFLKEYNLTKEQLNNYYKKERNKIKVELSKLPEDLKKIFLNAPGLYETQHTKITPVREGVTFRGRIRFENLSKVELGALLFAFDLPEDCAHKLGMAKPLGLGSVKITPTLYISDRQKRYTELFAEWDGIEPASRQQIDEFKKAFEEYVLENLNGSSTGSLWELQRMSELRTMLNWQHKPDNSKTEYLKLEKFRERPVLPAPSEVTKTQ